MIDITNPTWQSKDIARCKEISHNESRWMTVAVIGYEGSGRLVAEAFARKGMDVKCFAPRVSEVPASVVRVDTAHEAVNGAELVISLVSARYAVETAQICRKLIQSNAIYLDLNVSSVKTKEEVDEAIADQGRVIDGAIIESASSSADHAKILLSGDSSRELAQTLRNLDLQAEALEGPAGVASIRRLLFNVFVHGLHAVVEEVIKVGETVDAADWVRQQIADFLPARQDGCAEYFDECSESTGLAVEEMSHCIANLSSHSGDWPVLTSSLERHARQRYCSDVQDNVFEALAKLPTAAIGDGYDRLGFVGSNINAVWECPPISGLAFTVSTQAGDNYAIHEALKHAKKGDVLVVSAERGRERALIGDLIAERAKKAGIAGIVIDGPVRDKQGIAEAGLPVWAAGITAAGPYKTGPMRLGTPVAIGNAVCRHGDVVIADGEGILFIPPQHVPEAISSGQRVVADEEARRLSIRQP